MLDDDLRLARSIRDGVLHGTGPDLKLAAEILANSSDEWDRYSASNLRERAAAYDREVAAQNHDDRLRGFDLYEREVPDGAPVVYVMAGACVALGALLLWWF